MAISIKFENLYLSKALSDAAFGTIRTQTEYKCVRYGSSLILADRFFPSSQLCSNCGYRQPMPLKERVYNCSNCGMNGKERDLNASLNLENYHTYHTTIAVGLTASRSVEEVLPTVSNEADNKHQSSLSSFG